MAVAADCNDGLVKEGHPESNLLKSTFLPNQRINLTGIPLAPFDNLRTFSSIPADYSNIMLYYRFRKEELVYEK